MNVDNTDFYAEILENFTKELSLRHRYLVYSWFFGGKLDTAKLYETDRPAYEVIMGMISAGLG